MKHGIKRKFERAFRRNLQIWFSQEIWKNLKGKKERKKEERGERKT